MPPLIAAEDLHARIADPSLLVVDCRHDLADVTAGRRAYQQGHIPGAMFLHLDDDLSGPRHGPDGRFRGRHPLPDRAAFAHRLAALGVTHATTLVAYDAGDGMYASRLWWLARWIGHANVMVLDGGLGRWQALGYPLTTALPAPRAPAVAVIGESLVATIDVDALAADVAAPTYRILDARAPERYRGEVEPLDAKAGHIPGAHNRVFRRNLREDGRFKPPAELRAEFAEIMAGLPPERIVNQCGSGVTACHNLLAMAVAGIDGALLYPGSWSEWSSNPARPIATGSEP
jgi:thiosulfate/3-mercaptopyruvate sulfurtransferase